PTASCVKVLKEVVTTAGSGRSVADSYITVPLSDVLILKLGHPGEEACHQVIAVKDDFGRIGFHRAINTRYVIVVIRIFKDGLGKFPVQERRGQLIFFVEAKVFTQDENSLATESLVGIVHEQS